MIFKEIEYGELVSEGFSNRVEKLESEIELLQEILLDRDKINLLKEK